MKVGLYTTDGKELLSTVNIPKGKLGYTLVGGDDQNQTLLTQVYVLNPNSVNWDLPQYCLCPLYYLPHNGIRQVPEDKDKNKISTRVGEKLLSIWQPDKLVMYMHTSKAVKLGEPADRVFLVAGITTQGFLAWKCTLKHLGLEHPAYKRLLPFFHERLLKASSEQANNSEATPTAVFVPDSLYRRVSLEDVINCAQFTK